MARKLLEKPTPTASYEIRTSFGTEKTLRATVVDNTSDVFVSPKALNIRISSSRPSTEATPALNKKDSPPVMW